MQIAWGSRGFGGTGWKGGATIDFPAAFSGPPTVTATPRRADDSTWSTAFQLKEITSESFTFWRSYGLDGDDGMTSIQLYWIAVGTWQ